ncbi:MAG TPA: SusC/RagA family TonB-linked outer membrane protein [Saprospiraceae bacterium]|nr:SusC/RagA family TonB-linked outer membrane protein [Saprospiraceae bacterium]HMQ81779.1 SusC/RagA family TonB-linked outer membrane protein [Saprospiraceae bacterium]
MKKTSLVLALVLFAVGFAMAQRSISGTVTDNAGDPLIGASVLVKGTTTGTVTDIDGKYAVSLPEGSDVLIISYTGFSTQEVKVGASNVVDVILAEGVTLETAVVTALGIKREKKALGYAATVVGAEDVAQKPETDVARALIGRSPGVNITNSSGLAGSGTKINVRGTSTISGNSQPLWIVDGVPINTNANENNDFRDGNVTPTRNLDLDPNNIESISILRGLSATTLYGSAGRNGVILVTTKTGSGTQKAKKFTASVSQSYHVVNAIIPEYQDKWANGFDGDYGEFFSNWGSLFSNNREVGNHPYYEWRDVFPEFPEFAQPYTPVAQPNNVADFFQTGTSSTTSVNAGVNGDLGSFNVSFSSTNEDGYIKNNELERLNFTIGGLAKLTDRFSVNANFSYITTDFRTPTIGAGTGSNSEGGPSVFANLFYTPRNIDLTNWPFQHPVTGAPVFYRNNNSITNPYWLLDNSRQGSYVDRFLGVMAANLEIFDRVMLTYRIGVDTYSEDQEYYVQRGSVGYPAEVSIFSTGLYRTTAGTNTIYDHSLILNLQRNLSDAIDITANVGLNARDDQYSQVGLESTNQVVFGLVNHRNFINQNQQTLRNDPLSFISRRILLGAFADVTFGYKSFLYLNVQGRNDWASTHEKEYRSLFYPGVSASFVPTDAFDGLQSSFLSFLKIRAGYGTSANFADPYTTRSFLSLSPAFTVDSKGNVIALSIPGELANSELRPELQQELEAGLEARLFNDRISIDLSIYDRTAKDQIIERPLDPSTGYLSTFINAGTISNKGVELGVSITPIQTKDFSWNLRANYTRNRSLVEELPEGSEEINFSGFSNLGNFAIEGEPFGVIKGTYVVTNENGDRLITPNGDYKISSDFGIIGDPNPDYMLSAFTTINFKGFSLFGQLDYVHGGDIYSYSAATPIARGVAKELEDFNPELPVILPGVLEETGEPNNIPMPASGVFFGNTIIGGSADGLGIYDGTRVRLREIGLSYTVPKKSFGDGFVQGLTVALVGNNLWFRAVNTPKYAKVDPDRTAFGVGNGFGFDFLGGPSASRVGLTARVDF